MSILNLQPYIQNSLTQIIDNHITVKTAAEITGYNVQYLRRLLRAEKLDAIKIGQVWLVNLVSLQNYLENMLSSEDRRCGPN